MKNKLTKLEFKWICYDMGNSAFILLVATILPIYFNYLSSSQGVAEHNYLSYWSYAASLSTLIVALAGPHPDVPIVCELFPTLEYIL